ncbi:ComG operon protein 7 [Natribacillus halophilus]|uniref:ComG operon protein 7 n=2 Tax=Natribacillus halophilus TaxID=549003 RepID=A0A1G8JM19_9BACI|nr:ComG operon protein 7 [Natribacillus halophilus]
MPFVLVICLILAGLVGHQAVLLTFERDGLEAQRMFLMGNILLEKGEVNWWEAYMDDETSSDGSWEFPEGTVHYRITPNDDSDYDIVTLNAEVEDGGNVQHQYFVQKAENDDEDDDIDED